MDVWFAMLTMKFNSDWLNKPLERGLQALIAPIVFPRHTNGADIIVSLWASSSGVPGTVTRRESLNISSTISGFPFAMMLPVIPVPIRSVWADNCSLYAPSAVTTFIVLLSS